MFQSSNFIFITHKSIVTLTEYGSVSKHTLMDEVFFFTFSPCSFMFLCFNPQTSFSLCFSPLYPTHKSIVIVEE
jgi:hypothetical protein